MTENINRDIRNRNKQVKKKLKKVKKKEINKSHKKEIL